MRVGNRLQVAQLVVDVLPDGPIERQPVSAPLKSRNIAVNRKCVRGARIGVLVSGRRSVSILNGWPSTLPRMTASGSPIGNNGLVPVVGSDNDGLIRSTRWLSGASRAPGDLTHGVKRGLGIVSASVVLAPSGRVEAAFPLPEPVPPVQLLNARTAATNETRSSASLRPACKNLHSADNAAPMLTIR